MLEQYKCFDEAKEYLLNSGVVTMAHSSDLYLNTYCFEKQTNKQVKSASCLAASLCISIIFCHNRLECRRIVFLLVAVLLFQTERRRPPAPPPLPTTTTTDKSNRRNSIFSASLPPPHKNHYSQFTGGEVPPPSVPRVSAGGGGLRHGLRTAHLLPGRVWLLRHPVRGRLRVSLIRHGKAVFRLAAQCLRCAVPAEAQVDPAGARLRAKLRRRH